MPNAEIFELSFGKRVEAWYYRVMDDPWSNVNAVIWKQLSCYDI
jgi:hypothetical protein